MTVVRKAFVTRSRVSVFMFIISFRIFALESRTHIFPRRIPILKIKNYPSIVHFENKKQFTITGMTHVVFYTGDESKIENFRLKTLEQNGKITNILEQEYQ